MRRIPNEVKSQGGSGLARLGSRATTAKRSRLRRLTLESLEERALMATAPMSLVSNNAPISSNNNNNVNDSNPYVAIDPLDPQKLVTVYTDRNANNGTFIFAQAQYSQDGGLTWNRLNLPNVLPDLSSTTGASYSETDGEGVGFDRNGNVYVGILEHNGGSSGAVVLAKYDFSGSSPTPITPPQGPGGFGQSIIVYQWNQSATNQNLQPGIVNFALGVDSNLASFTDPSTGAVQADPTTGSVYIAWTTNTPPPSSPPNPYNPNVIELVASADGVNWSTSARSQSGQDTAVQLSSGHFGNQRYTAPALAISQGTAGVTATDVQTLSITHGPTNTPISGAVQVTFTNPTTQAQSTVSIPFNATAAQVQALINPIFGVGNVLVGGGDLPGSALTFTGAGAFARRLIPVATIGASTLDSGNTGVGTTPIASVVHTTLGGPVGGKVTVIWDDFGSFAGATPPQDAILSNSATFNGTTLTAGFQNFIAFTTVRGALSAPYSRASTASPIGIGPGAQIAVDNTLGSYSANQGTLYVTYVGHSETTGNPASNTDIFLIKSTNGGLSWSSAVKVNDDSGAADGYTGASSTNGRSQFDPAIAVDPSTGTLAISWLDARDDATNSRYATYLTTSIDGGQSFSKNIFANVPNKVTDAITGKSVVMGPESDNGSVETSLSFGSHQGLAISNGVIHPVWSGTTFFNVRGTSVALGDGFNKQLLGIETAQATYAYGPRVISGTMGPVASQTVNGLTFNNTFSIDHTQQVNGFTVTFDRPVNISSFTAADVQVIYRNTTTPLSLPGTTITLDPTNPIQAIDSAFDGSEATTFFIRFASPQSGVGTYSYSVGPNITDKMWSPPQNIVVPTGPATQYVATAPQVPKGIPDFNPNTFTDGVVTSTINVSGQSLSLVLANLTVTLDITHTYDSDLKITLISPSGKTVVLSNREGNSGDNFQGTTFDSASSNPISQGLPPFQGTYAPEESLASLFGGVINGTWTLEIRDQAFIDTGTLNSWSLNLTPGTVQLGAIVGHSMDQNANGKLDTTGTPDVFSVPTPLGSTPFQAPYNTATLPIIVPGPHVVSTFVPYAGVSADNLVLNNTVGSIDVVFDRYINPATFTGSQILEMMGPAGPITGTFVVTPEIAIPSAVRSTVQPDEDATHIRTFRISFPAFQQLSGTYTLKLGTGIRSTNGDLVDTNLNAGVSLLFQTPTAATTPVVYGPDVPLSSSNATISTSKSVTSTITVNDTFDIQGLQLGLNIVYPHDPDLVATLTFVSADPTVGTIVIPLFTNVGNVGPISSQQNFTNTSFSDDLTNTPIQNGGPPFTGRFNPQQPFSVLRGLAAKGTFTLTITSTATGGVPVTGQLTSFSLTLIKNSDAGISTGLGEPVADQTEASFRIFTMDPTNPLSSNTWTAVGGASNNGGANSGRIGGIAVDPSDPSGNTVFVAGASGGVWKTTNYLTTAPGGPTYIPLTNAAATNGINIGSIAVFGRNNDPKQSIVVVGTGEGDTTSPGVGFLISYNGGATWTLLDSLKNYDATGAQISSANRDHSFVGLTTFKVIIDPKATPSGNIIIYAAMAGFHNGQNLGGIYRSIDSGKTWQLMRAGFATDVAFDPNSNVIDAFSNPTGNIRTIYGAFQSDGIYISPNQGQLWNLMAGGVGDPLLQNLNPDTSLFLPIPVNAPANTPNGAGGRLAIVHPALTGDAVKDLLYENWLYVVKVTADGHYDGLYMTKDNGQNWVKVRIANAAGAATAGITKAIAPSNDITQPDYDILGGQGNYDVALAIDPNNPEVVYIGGSADFGPTALIRVDVSRVADAHSLFSDPTRNGGGLLLNTTDPISPFSTDPSKLFLTTAGPDPLTHPYSNLIRDPNSPFLSNATVNTFDAGTFANTGSGARWTSIGGLLAGTTDLHRLLAIKDPVSGKTRIIAGDDQGIFSGVDDGTGKLISSIGTQNLPLGSRNGNIQITQIYNGAAQPSNLAAQIAGALFYGMAQDDGFPQSDPNVLINGNINWSGSTGDGTSVATDATGSGTSYSYRWPCCGGGGSDFFQVNLPGTGNIGRTNGLIQSTTGPIPPLGGPRDPQWPSLGGFNFGVNPVNPRAMLIGSGAGRLFGTEDQGLNWSVYAEPSTFDSSTLNALTYGAPDPSAPGVPGALDNYILIGTNGGRIFVSFSGGGSTDANGNPTNAWTSISNGLNGSSVIRIVTDPTRGTHDAYATTSSGVFYNANTSAPGSTWVNITGNLFQQKLNPFGDPNLVQNQLASLGNGGVNGGLVADWRYVIPNDPTKPNGPTHPLLYVAGVGGVFRSTDMGATWSIFPAIYQSQPDASLNLTTPGGGYLPVAQVSSLSLAIGNVDPTTGHALAVSTVNGQTATSPNVLLASTYGQGSFAIRLAPVVFNDAVNKPTLTTNDQGQPIISGLSEQTAFGNKVGVTIVDMTDPANPIFLGGYNPAEGAPGGSPSFNNPANETDAFGRFSIQGTYPTPPPNNPYLYDGVRQLQLFATDGSGTKGNVVNFQITNNPPIPAAPILVTSHVVSGTTSLTDSTTPTFSVTIPGNSTIPVTVTLVRIDSQNNQRTVGTATITGSGTISDSGPVPQGTYTYEVKYQVLVGSLTVTSPLSPPTTVKIIPSITAALFPSDDSGIPNDNKTNVTQPRVFGIAPTPQTTPSDLSLDLVQVTSGGNITLGTIIDPSNGNYIIQTPTPLADGVYSLFVQARDSAGDTLASRPFSVTIKTIPPSTPPTLAILAADDSGILGDGKTNVRRPHLVGVTDPGATVNILDKNNNILASTTASTFPVNGHPTGYYSVQLASNLSDGSIPLYAVATDIEGNSTPVPLTPSLNLTIYTVQGDYNGDGKADLVTYRYDPTVVAGSIWYIRNSGATLGQFTPTQVPRGWAGHDLPVPGDYSGAGQTLTAIFRPETDTWYIGTPGAPTIIQQGLVGQDIPVPAAYDLSGRTEVATYNPSTQMWNVLLNISDPTNPSSKLSAKFGFSSADKPVPGDYLGVGYAQLAVYRSNGEWDVRNPNTLQPVVVATGIGGQAGDIPVPGDYDGVGRIEAAVYRPGSGQFIVFNPVTHATEIKPVVFPAGYSSQPGDIPVAQDYDGDGKIDLAVFRPSTDVYFIDYSSNGQAVAMQDGYVGHDVAPQSPLSLIANTIRGANGPGIPQTSTASPALVAPAFLVSNTTVSAATTSSAAPASVVTPAIVAAAAPVAAPAATATGKSNVLPAVVAVPTPKLTVIKASHLAKSKVKAIHRPNHYAAPKPVVVVPHKAPVVHAKPRVAVAHAKTPHDLALAALGKAHKGHFFG
jgi:subtilisin-like proprotein convertase family protein